MACFTSTGGFVTHALTTMDEYLLGPSDLLSVDAAAFTIIYVTTHHALIDRCRLQPGETVLVLGAAGAVRASAIQIAKAAGARVIAAVLTDEQCVCCREQGVDHVINYSHADLRKEIKRLTDSQGPDITYDPVSGSFTELAFRSIVWRGCHLIIGFPTRSIPTIRINFLLVKGAIIIGVFGVFSRRERRRQTQAR